MSDSSSFRDDAKAPYEPVIKGSVMVERVARAIAGGVADIIGSHTGNPLWMAYRDEARRAIEAMREPTEAMLAAGWDEALNHDMPITPVLTLIFARMIDAALVETAAPVAEMDRAQSAAPPIEPTP